MLGRIPAVVCLVALMSTPLRTQDRSDRLRKLTQEAALRFEGGDLERSLQAVHDGLVLSSNDQRLLTIGAWCHLRSADDDPARLLDATEWFARLMKLESEGEPSAAVLSGGARATLPAEARKHLQRAEGIFTQLIDEGGGLEPRLRRLEVRELLGDVAGARSDAARCLELLRVRGDRLADFERTSRSKAERRNVWAQIRQVRRTRAVVEGRLARLARRIGDHERARAHTEWILAMESPPFDSPVVRAALIEIMPEDIRALPALGYEIGTATDERARAAAAIAIGKFGARAAPAVVDLVDALGDSSRRVVGEAVTALGTIGPKARAALPYLRRLCRHPDAGIAARARAACAQVDRER